MEALTVLFQEGIPIDRYLNWFSILSSAIAVMMSAYLLWKKAKPEMEKMHSESDSSSAEAVESYANAAKMYSEEVRLLKQEQKELRKELDDNLLKIRELENKLEDISDYVDRLIHQIKSLNATPVPFRARKKSKDFSFPPEDSNNNNTSK